MLLVAYNENTFEGLKNYVRKLIGKSRSADI
jgi:hypothetical protein